eukprot:SAG31_NODE_34882_length_328_cov_0.890830_1_plen_71_part_01
MIQQQNWLHWSPTVGDVCWAGFHSTTASSEAAGLLRVQTQRRTQLSNASLHPVDLAGQLLTESEVPTTTDS